MRRKASELILLTKNMKSKHSGKVLDLGVRRFASN